jgi:hypothetical protein
VAGAAETRHTAAMAADNNETDQVRKNIRKTPGEKIVTEKRI